MRIKQLKLAGFKSFVEPTIVSFPSQLVAVVGPNGCGKSNIIDAVRWVLGESSAKNLRGGSMVDVIFNGAAQRKSVGQASVELIFDNNAGRFTGPFASYGEIAVKRIVTRDGDSAYFLNGNKCRRRDITDLFLGTGAGAKGYSIIGQGTISQIIEAKPEELRVFLEEAAGVSKYKERRRETILKIAQTREHLTRVEDIRNELDKQVQRLARQAQSAQRYLELKDEEKKCNAEILAFKWQELTHQKQLKLQELNNIFTDHEQKQLILTGFNTERLVLKEKLQIADEIYETTQATYYSLNNEITRLEAQIQQFEQEQKHIEVDKSKMQLDSQHIQDRLQQNYVILETSQQLQKKLDQSLLEIKEYYQKIDQKKQDSQKNYKLWQKNGEETQSNLHNAQSQLKISKINLHHLEQKYQSTQVKLEQIQQELHGFSLKELEDEQAILIEKQQFLEEKVEQDDIQLKQGKDLLQQIDMQFQEAEQQLQQLRDNFHHANTEHATLLAAQKAALNKFQSPEEQKQLDAPQLLDVLDVTPPWQFLCGRILNDALYSYVIEDFEEFFIKKMSQLDQYSMALTLQPLNNNLKPYPRLADQIKCSKPLGQNIVEELRTSSPSSPLQAPSPHVCGEGNKEKVILEGKIPQLLPNLESIYLAENLEQALNYLASLDVHESVLTLEGFWLGKGWAKWIGAEKDAGLDLLVNKQRISDLSFEIKTLSQKMDAAKERRELLQGQIQECRLNNETYQAHLLSSKEALNANHNALKANIQALEYAEKVKISWDKEQVTLGNSLKELETELEKNKEQNDILEQQFELYEKQNLNFLKEKETWEHLLEQQNKETDTVNDSMRELEMNFHKEMLKYQQLKESIEREKEALAKVCEALETLELKKRGLLIPKQETGAKLEDHLSRYSQIEVQWVQSKEQAAELKEKISILEKKILKQELEIKQIQELMNQIKMQEQELSLRAEGFKESITELGTQPELLLVHLPKQITMQNLEEQLLTLIEQIKLLGAINLAAIEEFAAEQERKLYLDGQHSDLSEALVLLETAIEQIDKETLLRLEQTFDEVNTLFKALFPRLFGGGSAQLELTCDNLLESGIVVMAQPPGKRNSSIHLLSGGEKAMTAVALIFAIFQLNPSPFCMLDEVDAPLDDVNVERFCDLVKEMSQFIQFLFITHNKVTMKLADHLIGVTMREPGVSRLVAVDVKEALGG